MRLGKFLANMGFGSRTDVRKLVRAKEVAVNGEIVNTDSVSINENEDVVTVYGEPIEYKQFVYVLLNKPKGYISATTDKNHKTVIDLVPEFAHFDIFPVGRLDIDTTGLLLLTNDGELSHKLLSPANHVKKTYKVTLRDEFNDDYIKFLKSGINLGDFTTLPATVQNINGNVCELTIVEGKFHQVKRMFAALGNEVIELERIKFGNLTLDNINQGEYIELSIEDIL